MILIWTEREKLCKYVYFCFIFSLNLISQSVTNVRNVFSIDPNFVLVAPHHIESFIILFFFFLLNVTCTIFTTCSTFVRKIQEPNDTGVAYGIVTDIRVKLRRHLSAKWNYYMCNYRTPYVKI